MDAHTRQQAWEEVPFLLEAAASDGKMACVFAVSTGTYALKGGYDAARRAAHAANRALDLLDQLRGEG